MHPHLQVVVFGILGQLPVAGVAWQALHYLEGFRRLGCEVYYVEDTGAWPYDPTLNTLSENCSYALNYTARVMGEYGLADRWAYCSASPERRIFGMTSHQLGEVINHADVLVNLTGATTLRKEHLRIPVRIYLQTDPVQAQVEAAQGDQQILTILGAHTHHFTFGENLEAPDCQVPPGPFAYQPTRQPIVLDWWPSEADRGNDCFTTIANWRVSGKDVTWNGETYAWSKHQEFLKFMDLPAHTPQTFELALACDDLDAIRLLRSHNWQVRDAVALSADLSAYHDYIVRSRGEFTVAKDQNIRLRSGWFSDRSACYLSAGRPVITQDTGFGTVLPTGKGLFAFRSMDQILEAIDQINSDYSMHSRAAEEIAKEYFSADGVLASLLERANA